MLYGKSTHFVSIEIFVSNIHDLTFLLVKKNVKKLEKVHFFVLNLF